MEQSELNRYNKAKRKLSIIFIVSSLLIFIVILLCSKFTGQIGFIPIATKNDSFFSELLGYGFVYIVFYVLYYAFMFLISLIEWYIISGKNNDFLTGKKQKGFYGITNEHNSKYDKELEYVQEKVIKIVTFIEYSILFLMFMFGIIKF